MASIGIPKGIDFSGHTSLEGLVNKAHTVRELGGVALDKVAGTLASFDARMVAAETRHRSEYGRSTGLHALADVDPVFAREVQSHLDK